MSYKVVTIKAFDDNAKKLSKKYPSLKNDLSELIEKLEKEPFTGISLGHGCYKIRLKIRSKGKGKSGGGRVITYVYIVAETVFLLSIYDKSDIADMEDHELIDLLKEIE